MNADVLKYLGMAAGLVFLYLVLKDASGTTNVINGLSNANTSMIKALQGR